MLDIIKTADDVFAGGTQYDARINGETLAMHDRHTGELLDAMAVIPSHAPDLLALINKVPQDLVGELERLVAWRAMGMEAPPPKEFDA